MISFHTSFSENKCLSVLQKFLLPSDFLNKFVKKDFSATHSNLISLINFLLILCFFKFLNFTCNCDSFDTAFVIVLFIKLLWFAQISFRYLRADLSKISEKE